MAACPPASCRIPHAQGSDLQTGCCSGSDSLHLADMSVSCVHIQSRGEQTRTAHVGHLLLRSGHKRPARLCQARCRPQGRAHGISSNFQNFSTHAAERCCRQGRHALGSPCLIGFLFIILAWAGRALLPLLCSYFPWLLITSGCASVAHKQFVAHRAAVAVQGIIKWARHQPNSPA